MVAKYLSVHDHIDHHQYSSHTRIEMFTFITQSKSVIQNYKQYQNVDVVRLKEERIYLLGMGVLVFRKWVVCQVAVSWAPGQCQGTTGR